MLLMQARCSPLLTGSANAANRTSTSQMIPSIVAQEITRALHDFLATGFGPSNPALATVLDDFLAEPENLVKGPYLSIALPPKLAPEGGEPFPEIPLGFTPYRHQRIAHQRLDSASAHGERFTSTLSMAVPMTAAASAR